MLTSCGTFLMPTPTPTIIPTATAKATLTRTPTVTSSPMPTATPTATVNPKIDIGGGVQIILDKDNKTVDKILAPTSMTGEEQARLLNKFDVTKIGYASDATKLIYVDGKMSIVDASDETNILARVEVIDGDTRVLWNFGKEIGRAHV